MTDTEQQIRDLCQDAKIKVLAVERTATQWIVTIGAMKNVPKTTIDQLNAQIVQRDLDLSFSYSNCYHEFRFMEIK